MTYQSGTGGAGMSDWLLGSVRKNPEGLLLLAAGAVLLMRKSTPSRTYQAETPHFPQSGGFRETTTDMQESGRGFAEQVKERQARWLPQRRKPQAPSLLRRPSMPNRQGAR
jgi:hypothetical protein